MRVGSIGYATKSGLGIQLKAFYDHGIVTDVLLIPHPHYQNQQGWYPTEHCYSKATLRQFLSSIDVLFLFENAFYWPAVQKAKLHGLRTIMMPNYEYTPFPMPSPADLYLCPSLLDLDYYKDLNSQFIPVPVEVPWKLRERACHFIHHAGHGGKGHRNGTPELLEAMRYVQSPIKLDIHGQPGEKRIQELFQSYVKKDPRVSVTLGEVPEAELWSHGDVFIFPEKFNGLSLPLQEARAAGMLVMATNRFPMNTWLPQEPLIPVEGYEQDHIAVDIHKAVISPQTIAKTIDAWYDRDIVEYSKQGRDWAASMSWEVIKPRYLSAIESVLA